MSADFRLIASPAELDEVSGALAGADRIALDIEADGYHRYPERTALVQVAADDGQPLLIDPLALDAVRLESLGVALADPSVEVLVHASGYDVRMLARDLGFSVHGLFDTAVGAQFCGQPKLGLENVVRDTLGLDLGKSKRFQRFDWSIRPLPEEALAYAADDVRYLGALRDELRARLGQLGRETWVAEECRRLEDVRFGPDLSARQACLRLSGARDLDDRQRAILAAVFEAREREALEVGRPPHRVYGNADVVATARRGAPVRAGRLPDRWRESLREAIALGKGAEPLPWPRQRGRNPWTQESRDRLAQLKRWRSSEAGRLNLDPGVVWPAPHLERMALYPDEDPRELDTGDPQWVRDWQWEVLGESMSGALP